MSWKSVTNQNLAFEQKTKCTAYLACIMVDIILEFLCMGTLFLVMADMSKILFRLNKPNQTTVSDFGTPAEPQRMQVNKGAGNSRQSNVSYMNTRAEVQFLKVEKDSGNL